MATVGSGLGLWLPLLRSAGESEARVCETACSAATHRKPGKESKRKRERERERERKEKRKGREREKIRKRVPYSTAKFCRSLSASGIAWALAWDQFMGSDNVGRVPIERKLARVPTPRVFPGEPKTLLQANITIDHRSQSTEETREREN